MPITIRRIIQVGYEPARYRVLVPWQLDMISTMTFDDPERVQRSASSVLLWSLEMLWIW